jgi:hypothetical protein
MASRTYAIARMEDEIHQKLDELDALDVADCITKAKLRAKFFPRISQTRFNQICIEWESKTKKVAA